MTSMRHLVLSTAVIALMAGSAIAADDAQAPGRVGLAQADGDAVRAARDDVKSAGEAFKSAKESNGDVEGTRKTLDRAIARLRQAEGGASGADVQRQRAADLQKDSSAKAADASAQPVKPQALAAIPAQTQEKKRVDTKRGQSEQAWRDRVSAKMSAGAAGSGSRFGFGSSDTDRGAGRQVAQATQSDDQDGDANAPSRPKKGGADSSREPAGKGGGRSNQGAAQERDSGGPAARGGGAALRRDAQDQDDQGDARRGVGGGRPTQAQDNNGGGSAARGGNGASGRDAQDQDRQGSSKRSGQADQDRSRFDDQASPDGRRKVITPDQQDKARRNAEDAQDKARDTQQKAARDAQDKTRDAQKATQDAQDKARDAQQKSARDAQDKARRSTEDAQDKARDAQKATQDTQDKARDAQQKSAQDAQDKARRNAEDAQDKAGRDTQDAGRDAQDKLDANRKATQDAQDKSKRDGKDSTDAARGEKQDDRQNAGGEKRDDRRDARDEKQDDRRDARDEKQGDRQNARGEKQDDRRDARGERQDDRKDARGEKQDDRRNARDDLRDGSRPDAREGARRRDEWRREWDGRADERREAQGRIDRQENEWRDRVRGQKRQVEERDGRTIIREGDNRVIVREGDRMVIRHREGDRFRLDSRDVKVAKRGNGEIETTYVRPDGDEIISIEDSDGRLLRRSRRDQDGRIVVLIDNYTTYNNYGGGSDWRERGGNLRDERRRRRHDHDGFGLDFRVDLPPVQVDIPRDEYIVDADDASYDDIEEAFEAPPVERVERRYSLDEVRYNHRIREKVRRVDLNTINFAFGQWEVPDDQIDRLDNIGRAIDAVIKKNPDEVFLIEGHTDAVGSDEDNLTLSDRRAEAVAIILSQYFKIPAENLVTQGYGEQYLKVQTEEPERANRRVTARRITPLLSQNESSSNTR